MLSKSLLNLTWLKLACFVRFKIKRKLQKFFSYGYISLVFKGLKACCSFLLLRILPFSISMSRFKLFFGQSFQKQAAVHSPLHFRSLFQRIVKTIRWKHLLWMPSTLALHLFIKYAMFNLQRKEVLIWVESDMFALLWCMRGYFNSGMQSWGIINKTENLKMNND